MGHRAATSNWPSRCGFGIECRVLDHSLRRGDAADEEGAMTEVERLAV
jgi:hypothetical protein